MLDTDELMSWNVELEVSLFHAMRKHKPVGVNRHFQMLLLHDKFSTAASQSVTAKQIWKHLSEMYDLQALNESEILPFPNKEGDFILPESDFEHLIKQDFPRAKETPSTRSQVEDETPVVPVPTKNTPQTSAPSKTGKTGYQTHSQVAVVAKEKEAEDSPKREQRKRTRQAVSSPVVTDTTPTTSKRQRRI